MARTACRLLRKLSPYNVGEIAGFEGKELDELLERGIAEPLSGVPTDSPVKSEPSKADSDDAGGSVVAPEPSPPQESPWRSLPVFDLAGVSDRAKQLLVGAGLETIGHLVDYRAARGNFTGIKGIGPETDEDIKAAIEPHTPGAAEAAEHVDGE